MALKREDVVASHYIADEKLWLNADRTKVVKDGDPEAAFLFATPGKRISVEDAETYKLTSKLTPEEATKELSAPEANKAMKAAANKAKAEAKAETPPDAPTNEGPPRKTTKT